MYILATRSARSVGEEGLCFARVSKIPFSDFCQTDYLNIYRTDLHEICRIGGTSAVDERSEVTFLIPRGTLPWQPVFCVGAILTEAFY